MNLKKTLACLFSCLAGASLFGAGVSTWKDGDGNWEEAAKWGGALPGANGTADVAGTSHITLDHSNPALSRLDLGEAKRADATLTMDGGSLTAMEFIRLGEYPGTHGRFVLNGGKVRTTEIGVGGMNQGEPGRSPCKAELEISGGSLVTGYLMMGWQPNSVSKLKVTGSKAEHIVTLNAFDCCIPLGTVPSNVELGFDLDGGGVTPVIYWNKKGRMELKRQGHAGVCTLRVGLVEAPPAGDITLVRCFNRCSGEFQGLPEGSPVKAEHEGKTYEWKLTYVGGASKADVMLTDPQVVDAHGQKTPYQSDKKQREVNVDPAMIKAAWEELYAQADKAAAPLENGPLAFPGAEGFGAHAKGGRGGRLLAVTNLDDSGPGSLRWAIDGRGPRTVIFKVGGTIELKKALQIREPFITIAGQTAPGDGICLKGAQDTLTLLDTHDVIVRGLRVRTGHTGDKEANEGDCITAYSAENFIIDHCSASWGTDETLSCTQTCDRYTIQWCVIAEGLDYYNHSMASLLGGDRSSWHHNLFAHCGTRNPRFCGTCRSDFRNNVIYDWNSAAGYGDFREVNYVGNYLRPGPSTKQKKLMFITGDSVLMPGSLFLQGNMILGHENLTADNRLGTGCDPDVFAAKPFAMPPVATQPVGKARDLVLAKVGATAPARDAVDARLVEEVRNGTGRIIRTEKDLPEAWPKYKTAPAPIDSLDDGIPDEWKLAHGLPLSDATLAAKVNEDGHTNLEVYLNSLLTPDPLKLTGALEKPSDKPLVRIALVGDSTVTDSAGWGVGFKELLADNVMCVNRSAGGRSSKSFRTEGRWEPVLKNKPDYVFIQFGHNDEPGKGPERETDPATTFRENIARYVDEARKAGARPILVTSIARRRFDKDGKAEAAETMTRYVEAVRKLAVEKQVPLVDLQTRTLELYNKLGKEGCEKEISPITKGQIDGTHLNLNGSRMVGRMVAEEIRKAVPELAAALR